MRHIPRGAADLLLVWYRAHKRDLPWRESKDAYRVWISEIMLQQTRVEAVKESYRRFLQRFPTPAALAAANEDEVLKSWEGLGYYSRARNLHAAAKRIAAEGFPTTYEGVRALPGVGDYTAGAICSIAYDMPCPAVDGNVLRVITRLLAEGANVDDKRTRDAVSAALSAVYPPEAGEFCQALMELGALVCVPNGAPACSRCPWEKLCLAHAEGNEERYPVRSEKRPRRVERVQVFVLRCGERYALEKRAERGLLAGMWQFPLFSEGETPPAFGKELARREAVHVFTHVEWHMTGVLVEAERAFPQYRWATAEEIRRDHALPSAFRAFCAWLEVRSQSERP